MKHYETLFLLRTDSTEDKVQTLEKGIYDAVKSAGGEVVSFEKWGRYKLAYPVNKQNYGIYILSRYNLPRDKTKTFFQEFDHNIKVKCSDFVMRHVNVLLPASKANSSYNKPDPIDETVRDVSNDRIIMSISSQSIVSDDLGYQIDSQSEGEVLDVSKLSLDPEDEN